MLLIWGWRSLLHVIGTGEFHCPRCGVDTPYRHVRPRRWFTFFFIPVIPLKFGENFVECTRCKSGFQEGILGRPTNKQFGFMLALGARALYTKAFADEYPHDDSLTERAVAALRPYTGDDYNEANLLADVEAFAPTELGSYLRPIGENMVLQGRESMMVSFIQFARSVGPLTAEVTGLASEAAAALDLTAAHLAGIVGSTVEGDRLGGGAHEGGALEDGREA